MKREIAGIGMFASFGIAALLFLQDAAISRTAPIQTGHCSGSCDR